MRRKKRHEGQPAEVGTAQEDPSKGYLRIIDREVDKIAQSTQLWCFKAYFKYKEFLSFIWELNNLRWGRKTPK